MQMCILLYYWANKMITIKKKKIKNVAAYLA